MRITTSGAANRNAYYDRNPLVINSGFVDTGFSPSGTAARSTYTVPTGRKFALERIAAFWRRVSAATGASLVDMYVDNGNRKLMVFHALTNVIVTDNTQKYGETHVSGPTFHPAGTVINASYGDASTGGTTDAECVIVGTEFDA